MATLIPPTEQEQDVHLTNDTVRGDIANALQLLIMTDGTTADTGACLDAIETRLRSALAKLDVTQAPELFTDADEAYCIEKINEWRQTVRDAAPGTYSEPAGNGDIWLGVLGGIRAVRAGRRADLNAHLTGVAIDGSNDDIRRAQLLARMSAYTVATWRN